MSEATDQIAQLTRVGLSVDCPAGTVRTTVNTVADVGWLLFGQTVTAADRVYPALWVVVPAGWKSGTSLVLPDMADRVVEGVGVTAVGVQGGSNSKTITANNLPIHTHPITDPNHNHTQNAHNHGDVLMPGTLGGNVARIAGDYSGTGTSSVGVPSLISSVNSAANYASTQNATATNVAASTGITGTGNNTTTATALDVTPAHLALVYQIRAF